LTIFRSTTILPLQKTVPTITAPGFLSERYAIGLDWAAFPRGTKRSKKNSPENSPASREKITQPNGRYHIDQRATFGDLGRTRPPLKKGSSRKNRDPTINY